MQSIQANPATDPLTGQPLMPSPALPNERLTDWYYALDYAIRACKNEYATAAREAEKEPALQAYLDYRRSYIADLQDLFMFVAMTRSSYYDSLGIGPVPLPQLQ